MQNKIIKYFHTNVATLERSNYCWRNSLIANTQKKPFHGIYFFITLDKSNMAIKMHNIGKSM